MFLFTAQHGAGRKELDYLKPELLFVESVSKKLPLYHLKWPASSTVAYRRSIKAYSHKIFPQIELLESMGADLGM
jgi:hypothetical protein